MAITIEDVLQAAETIEKFCKEFEDNFPKRMQGLVGEDIIKLCDDRQRLRYMPMRAQEIKDDINGLNFKQNK